MLFLSICVDIYVSISITSPHPHPPTPPKKTQTQSATPCYGFITVRDEGDNLKEAFAMDQTHYDDT